MLKMTSVLLLVSIFMTVTMYGQTLPNLPTEQPLKESQIDLRQKTQPDLKKVFDRETEKFNKETAAIDAKKMEKIQRQTPRHNWTKKEKTWLVIGIIATAALVFVLIKYGKTCKEYENNCSPSEDGCYCRVYEEDED